MCAHVCCLGEVVFVYAHPCIRCVVVVKLWSFWCSCYTMRCALLFTCMVLQPQQYYIVVLSL